jgi:hypothetical protein
MIDGDINVGGSDYITVKSSNVVRLQEHFTLYTENGPIDLKVDISADFISIPQDYQEVFLNMLTSKYLNKVSFTENPFSQCEQNKKRRWWQFWKSKYVNQLK